MMTDTEKKELKGFNPGQLEAITSPVKENILISAGAGSGKTKTLSYKVYHLVAYEGVKPSELLVLTFTNKAAFEMKERIIKQFKDHQGKDSPLAQQIVSAHIQTFDSFSGYLVKKYASLLHLPENISIADDSILETKKSEILDEILREYYTKEPDRIYKTFSRFCTADDRMAKRMILSFDDSLNKLMPSKRKEFMENYDERYLSREGFHRSLEAFVDEIKMQFKVEIGKALFAIRTQSMKDNAEILVKAMNNPDYYRVDRDCGNEFMSDICRDIFKGYMDCLTQPAEKFFETINTLRTSADTKDLFNARKMRIRIQKACSNKDDAEYQVFYKGLNDYVKKEIMEKYINVYGVDMDKLYEKNLSFRDDIHLFFEIVKRMNERLDDYKLQTNSYTFNDISYKALFLLLDDRYQSAKEEIQDRFKYILVDEYQDTNDVQETFLTALSRKATLFCVGDAKQSIYRFRNSNVQLFMNRLDRYEKDPSQGKVISMNWNYRSDAKLLDNINRIFDHYMTKEHGGLDFAEKKILPDGRVITPQRLDHDPGFHRNRAEGSFYGLGMINFSSVEFGQDFPLEIKTILHDIQDKITHHYQVIDGDTFQPRDCRYSDFAILTRSKKKFSDFQKAFDDAGVPLNVVTEDHLTQINAILLLQSVINLVSAYIQHEKHNTTVEENIPHLFMSVARSYIYGKRKGYDDDHIYQILTSPDKKKLYEDPIMVKVKDFAHRHKDSPLSVIFLDMLKEFEILDDLVYVGNVISNTDKIESFYQIVCAQEAIGQGIEDFVTLFKNVSKYQIDIAAETDVEIEDAVNLMSIHKSKGLEFPIVYMPLHCNAMNASKQDKLACNLSLDSGLILPDYQYNENAANILNAMYYLFDGSDREEVNEHVRIFYVALTRAKEALYIVGNEDPKTLRKQLRGTLYDMLDSTAHYLNIRKSYLDFLVKQGIITKEEVSNYQRLIKEYSLFVLEPSKEEEADYLRRAKRKNFEDQLEIQREKIADLVASFREKLVEHMMFYAPDMTEDQKVCYFAFKWHHRYDIHSVGEYQKAYPQEKNDFDSLFDAECARMKDYLPSPDDKKKKKKVLPENEFQSLSYALYGLKYHFDIQHYDEEVVTRFFYDIHANPEAKADKKEYPLPKVKVDDSIISFDQKVRVKGRASKVIVPDPDETLLKALDYGTRLHSYLELTDFRTKDTSFITDKGDRAKIDAVLSLPVFADVKDADIYHEYSYFDPVLNSQGSIDCLLVFPNKIRIIDYKTKEIDDPEYVRQLNVYRRNIERLFPGKPVSMYLLSILDCKTREVPVQEE